MPYPNPHPGEAMSIRHCMLAATAMLAIPAGAPAQQAETAPGAEQPAAPATSDQPLQSTPSPSIAALLPNPDPGGVRVALGRAGIIYSLTYIGEGLGNATGGVRRGSGYQGRLDAQLDVDMETLAGLRGLVLHANAYQIHGRGLSTCCVGNLLTASGIEATPATRLFEAWFQQTVLGGTVAVRAGQMAADTEFLVSQYGALFVNATFGWPTLPAANLPSGGPAYPLATPGVRLKLAPSDALTLLVGAFNGDPAGPGDGDPQRRNRSGTDFRTRDPALLIGELSYSYNQAQDAPGLPGTVKLGGYHHFGSFDDLRAGIDGLSLADPDGSGTPRRRRGSIAIYGVVDQLLYRKPGTADQGLGAFARVSGSPGDGGLISFYADGGLTYKGLLSGREDDTIGLGVGYARVSRAARGLDRDAARFSGMSGQPIRSSEVLVELTYQAQVVPGFTLQPDLQYVIRPGGRAPNPRDPNGAAIKDALVLGLRATVRY
ncbi:MAG: carbohydrate porin [Gemmatimonadaceae bacterium]|nr:carbohydrate porin [Acetobacteraceae bacterium]